jgi:chaperonin GroEL (HSP60 family)
LLDYGTWVHRLCSALKFSFPQVGDGTTTVVLLAAEFLKEAKPYVEDGVHPHSLIRSYRTAGSLVCSHHLYFQPLTF